MLTELDWHAVERLREISFRTGALHSPADDKLLRAAMHEDLERYSKIGTDLRAAEATKWSTP